MATPAAHFKLKLLLRAWLSYDKHFVYWQGLDSLATPFVWLNFNDIRGCKRCVPLHAARVVFSARLRVFSPLHKTLFVWLLFPRQFARHSRQEAAGKRQT